MKFYVLIVVCGFVDLIYIYVILSELCYKCVICMFFDEQISCVMLNDEYIFVGLSDGKVCCVLKIEMKKSDKKCMCCSFIVGCY